MKTMIMAALLLTACGKEGDTVQQYFTEPAKVEAVKDPRVVVKKVVCDGSGTDSKVSGRGYCDLLKAMGWNATDVSIADQSPTVMIYAGDVDGLYDAEPTPAGLDPEVQFSLYWEGPQALIVEQMTPEAAYALLDQYVKGRASMGWKTGVLTMLTQLRSDSKYWISDEIWRQKYNALIIENTAKADLVVNLDTDQRLSNCNNVTYFSPDLLHLANAGVAAVYELVEKALTDGGFVSKSESEESKP